ncbi:PREDICTED: uncharacterized protein LOC109214970 [Nicotiana attenuata]|uniref:uncharacterized protein LOC109214970 n=1 Tax=Nicotiana attenuata TaxID=49451 RepID=UPI000905ADC9|nr:PREDICTED: uncharacterized protein LOC109214970 [Nicotiana attenuata]
MLQPNSKAPTLPKEQVVLSYKLPTPLLEFQSVVLALLLILLELQQRIVVGYQEKGLQASSMMNQLICLLGVVSTSWMFNLLNTCQLHIHPSQTKMKKLEERQPASHKYERFFYKVSYHPNDMVFRSGISIYNAHSPKTMPFDAQSTTP